MPISHSGKMKKKKKKGLSKHFKYHARDTLPKAAKSNQGARP